MKDSLPNKGKTMSRVIEEYTGRVVVDLSGEASLLFDAHDVSDTTKWAYDAGVEFSRGDTIVLDDKQAKDLGVNVIRPCTIQLNWDGFEDGEMWFTVDLIPDETVEYNRSDLVGGGVPFIKNAVFRSQYTARDVEEDGDLPYYYIVAKTNMNPTNVFGMVWPLDIFFNKKGEVEKAGVGDLYEFAGFGDILGLTELTKDERESDEK